MSGNQEEDHCHSQKQQADASINANQQSCGDQRVSESNSVSRHIPIDQEKLGLIISSMASDEEQLKQEQELKKKIKERASKKKEAEKPTPIDHYARYGHLGKEILNWMLATKDKYEKENKINVFELKAKIDTHRINNRKELFGICILGFAQLKYKLKTKQQLTQSEKAVILSDEMINSTAREIVEEIEERFYISSQDSLQKESYLKEYRHRIKQLIDLLKDPHNTQNRIKIICKQLTGKELFKMKDEELMSQHRLEEIFNQNKRILAEAGIDEKKIGLPPSPEPSNEQSSEENQQISTNEENTIEVLIPAQNKPKRISQELKELISEEKIEKQMQITKEVIEQCNKLRTRIRKNNNIDQ